MMLHFRGQLALCVDGPVARGCGWCLSCVVGNLAVSCGSRAVSCGSVVALHHSPRMSCSITSNTDDIWTEQSKQTWVQDQLNPLVCCFSCFELFGGVLRGRFDCAVWYVVRSAWYMVHLRGTWCSLCGTRDPRQTAR